MLYRPKDELMWDTWLVPHEGAYYLFYIRISSSRDPDSPPPSLGDGWNGISVARSTDLLHWQELGPVLEKHPKAAWLGTGMIHRVGQDFVMNFSEERPKGYQVVCFAKSADLLQWERLPEEYDIRPDSRFYQSEQSESVDPLPRWDSLGVVPPTNEDEEFYSFICANARGTLPGECGTLGLLSSHDGLKWEQRPPVVAPGLYPSYEVPEYVRFGNRHYVLFCTNSTAAPRFDPFAQGPHSGTYYIVANQITGPYVHPFGDNMLLGQRNTTRLFGTYVGRPFRLNSGEVLYYHQWTAKAPIGWWGPPKVLREDAPYQLTLGYWPGCEGLKGSLLAEGASSADLSPLKAAGMVPVVEWSAEGGSVRARNCGGAHGIEWRVPLGQQSKSFTDLVDGRILELGLRVQSGRGLGIWLGRKDNVPPLSVVFNAESKRLEFGSMVYTMHGASLLFQHEEGAACPIITGVRHDVRVLARKNFVEVYMDDRLIHGFPSPTELDLEQLGFFAELASGDFITPRLWAMA